MSNKINEVTYSTVTWNPGDMLEAAFMFPTHQYEDQMALDCSGTEDYCNVIQSMLEPLQPLPNEVRKALADSVRSGNRVRVLFQSMKLVSRHADALGETRKTDVPDAKLNQVFGYHGYREVGDGVLTDVDVEVLQNSWEVADALASEVT